MKDFSQDKWGLVLNGGGGKCAYQIGVFKALCEMAVTDKIAGVSGSSAGALNTVLFAMKDPQIAEDIWKGIAPEDFLTIDLDLIDDNEGFVSRNGLLQIIDKKIDLESVAESEISLYACVTELGAQYVGEGKAKYFSLNYKPEEEIKKILLASSALPVIYEAVEIDGKQYRDGGLTDNSPIAPLYAEGIRHFIVIGLSTDGRVKKDRYPDAEFIYIKPSKNIGNFVDGTMDFSAKGAKLRMKLGYLDGMRELEFSDKDMSDPHVKILYEARKNDDITKIEFEEKQGRLKSEVNSDMDALNALLKKWDI